MFLHQVRQPRSSLSGRAPPRASRVAPIARSASPLATVDPARSALAERLLTRFKLADTDGNGCIDRQELRRLMESMDGGEDAIALWAKHWLTDEELQAVMDNYDKDKNGTIDFDEFKQIVYDGLLLEGTLHDYEDAFRAMDSSSNGSIGANELARMLMQLGQAVKIEDLVDIFQKYDKDESGQIEFGEFLKMFRDKILDLKAMKEYVALRPKTGGPTDITAPMLSGEDGDLSLIFSEKELDEALAQGERTGKLVLVFGSLTWCRPCKAMQRPVLKLADQYKDVALFVKLVGNANAQTKAMFSARLKVRSTPCFIVFRGQEVAFSMTGANKEKLEEGIRSVADAAKLPERLYDPPAAPPS